LIGFGVEANEAWHPNVAIIDNRVIVTGEAEGLAELGGEWVPAMVMVPEARIWEIGGYYSVVFRCVGFP